MVVHGRGQRRTGEQGESEGKEEVEQPGRMNDVNAHPKWGKDRTHHDDTFDPIAVKPEPKKF